MDSWICGWGGLGFVDLWIRGFVDGEADDSFVSAEDWEGRETGLGGGERTGCVGGAAVVAVIAGSGRGPEPGGRGEGAGIAVAGERR